MDLRPDAAATDAAALARAALDAGGPPPVGLATVTERVAVAREVGRAAGPVGHAGAVLTELLGGDPARAVTAVVTVDGQADLVPVGSGTELMLVVVDDATVGEVDLGHGDVVVEPRPSLADPDTVRVVYPASAMTTRAADTGAALARATIVAAADAVGAAEGALAETLAHVTRREQFGGPLAGLQVVRHRCADMAIDVRLALDTVLDAAAVADRDEDPAEVALVAHHAALAVGRCARVTAAAHQLAGGAGILAAAPHHRWYRRVKALDAQFGPPRRHREALGRAALARRGEARP